MCGLACGCMCTMCGSMCAMTCMWRAEHSSQSSFLWFHHRIWELTPGWIISLPNKYFYPWTILWVWRQIRSCSSSWFHFNYRSMCVLGCVWWKYAHMSAVAKETKDSLGSPGLELQVVISHLVGAEKGPSLGDSSPSFNHRVPLQHCSLDSQICPLLMRCGHCLNTVYVANRLSHCGNL